MDLSQLTELPETKFARSGDVSIAYQVWGDGPPDMVFVPGLIWHLEGAHALPGVTDFFRRLAQFNRVAVFDKRGQGLSDRVPGAATLEERIDDVRAVMDAIGMRRVALCGYSEGAMMSVVFAASFPECVSHLILLGGLPKYSRTPEYPHGFTEEAIRKSVEFYGKGSLFKIAAPSWKGQPIMAQAPRLERLSCSPGNFRALTEMNLKLDVRHVLPSIRVPTLVLHRKTDIMAPVEGARYFAAQIPGAKLIEYETGDHWPTVGDYHAICADIEEFVTGERGRTVEPVDRVLATVLFTDIVDSTAHAARIGDTAWRKTMDEHDRISRRLIEQYRGRLIKSTGDGLLATFDGPGRAIRCALAMEPWLARLQLSVRAGLHMGEVEDRGDDIGGIAVHIAARIMARAEAGEVVVSRVVADLVAGSGIKFQERGTVDLKGVPGQWALFAANL